MPDEIRFLGDMQRLAVRPGDVFVLTTDQHITDETAKRLRSYWRGMWEPGETAPKLIILAEGLKLGVFNPNTEVDCDVG